MTGIELYKFIQKNDIEIAWNYAYELMVWIDFDSISEFVALAHDAFDDGGLDVVLQNNVISFDIVPICKHFEIDPESILSK